MNSLETENTFLNKKINLVLIILFAIAAFISIFPAAQLNYYLIALVIATIPVRLFAFKTLSIRENFSSYIIWIYLELAFNGHAVVKFVLKDEATDQFSLLIGNYCLIFFALILMIKSKIFPMPKPYPQEGSAPKEFPKPFVLLAIIIPFFLTFVSHKLGIARMGVPHPELPYKIEPMLNLFRNISIPIFFAIFIDFYSVKKKGKVLLCLIYLTWLIAEAYIRGSRGAIAIGLLPVIFYSIHIFNLKRIIITVSLFLFISPITFILGNHIRNINVNATNTLSPKETTWLVYHRLFNEPIIIEDFKENLSISFLQNKISFFSSYNGLNNYYTHIIKKVPRDASHSQGITAISDSLAHFGLIGPALTLLIFYLLGIFGDYLAISLKLYGVSAVINWMIFNWLIWGEGFWDFYLNRSIFTISVAPLSIIFAFLTLSKLSKPLIETQRNDFSLKIK